MKIKRCRVCGGVKPVACFVRRSDNGELRNNCRQCTSAYNFKHYNLNKDRYKMLRRRWMQQHKAERRRWLLKYRIKNAKRISLRQREHYLANKDRICLQHREYYASHREALSKHRRRRRVSMIDAYRAMCREAARKYRNTIKGKAQSRAYRWRRQALESSLTLNTVQQVYEENIAKYGRLTCELCFKPVKFGEDSLEHFHPISRASEYEGKDINERSNLGIAHKSCNDSKNDRTLAEYKSFLSDM